MAKSGNGQTVNLTRLQTAASLFAAPCASTMRFRVTRSNIGYGNAAPGFLVDRVKGSVTALHLPDYDPTVSDSHLVP